ncbi:hypothetical protein DRQ09_05130 [candidate division KSB1 bacterium]|nr:MAG: hypothetical protein DRQ09_05130 [candidate division KSB1 bacterium]
MDFNIENRINNSIENAELERIKRKIRNSGGKYSKKDIETVAKSFEAIFIYKMLKEMKNTVPENTLFGKGLGNDIFQDFLYEEYANRISEKGSVGPWKMIFNSLSKYVEPVENKKHPEQFKISKFQGNLPTKIKRYNKETVYDKVERYNRIIQDASLKYGVDPDIIRAIITQESRGNPGAVSRKGAGGLMQILESTAKDLGIRDVFNPVDNIFGGVKYLKTLLEKHNGNLELALASYNAGPSSVEKYGGIPPYFSTDDGPAL